MKLRFCDCRLDTDARQLFRNIHAVPLSPKAFELLKLLIEQRPRALSKDELLERVWPGVFVSQSSLARVINEIRRAVGDRARVGGIVRTAHAFGYAFAADVEEEGAAELMRTTAVARCWLTCQGREFVLAEGEHVVGREPGLAIWLDSPKVSRCHARVVIRGGRATLKDLGSKNGTFVRGIQIAEPVMLEDGDAIRIGGIRLTFHVSARLPPTEPELELLS